MGKEEQQPFLFVETEPERRRPWFKLSSLLAAAICVMVGYHAFHYVTVRLPIESESDCRLIFTGRRDGRGSVVVLKSNGLRAPTS